MHIVVVLQGGKVKAHGHEVIAVIFISAMLVAQERRS